MADKATPLDEKKSEEYIGFVKRAKTLFKVNLPVQWKN